MLPELRPSAYSKGVVEIRREGGTVPIYHTVVAGDTLWSIAGLYGTTVDQLRALNSFTSDLIYVGQVLEIPEEEAADSADIEPSTPILPSIEGGFVLPEGIYTKQDLDDINLLARLVFAEARGEPYEGQIAVAAVLLNRVRHPEFPKSISAAVFQPYQFEVVSNGTIYQTPNNLAYQAVLEAQGGNDPANGALFFWNPRKVPASSWVWTRTVTKQIGNHVFA